MEGRHYWPLYAHDDSCVFLSLHDNIFISVCTSTTFQTPTRNYLANTSFIGSSSTFLAIWYMKATLWLSTYQRIPHLTTVSSSLESLCYEKLLLQDLNRSSSSFSNNHKESSIQHLATSTHSLPKVAPMTHGVRNSSCNEINLSVP